MNITDDEMEKCIIILLFYNNNCYYYGVRASPAVRNWCCIWSVREPVCVRSNTENWLEFIDVTYYA